MTNIEILNTLLNELLKVVLAIVCVLITVFARPLIKKLTDWLAQKLNTISDESKEKIFNESIDMLNKLVTTVVESLEQEYASEIRKMIKTGEATRDELCELKDKAIETVESQLSDTVKKILETKINDVSKYVSDLISEKVRQVKITNNLL